VKIAATTIPIKPNVPEITPEKYNATSAAATNNLIARSAFPIFFIMTFFFDDRFTYFSSLNLAHHSLASYDKSHFWD
jgi:hypothetical protein